MVRLHVRIFRGRSRYPGLRLGAGVVVVALLLGWATFLSVPAVSGAPEVRTPPAVGCTVDAVVGSVPPVEAGGVVCLSGTSDRPLTITEGGTVDSPVIYSCGGTATVRGIRVEASNVIVQGFVSRDAAAMGARLVGDNIVFLDNLIVHPIYTGDDTDGIRFFGDHSKIVQNTIADISEGRTAQRRVRRWATPGLPADLMQQQLPHQQRRSDRG